MDKTRFSLFYVAGYLWLGGIALLAAPQTAVALLLSNGQYSDLMLRMVGSFMVSLAIFVTQLIRHQAYRLYPTTLMVRGFLVVTKAVLYVVYRDPMLLVLMGIVGLGMVMTSSMYFWERGSQAARAAGDAG